VKPRFWLPGTLLALAMVRPAAAQAPAQSFELSWEVPSECPEEGVFRSQVLRLAGHDAEQASELRAKVNIERSPEVSYRLTLQTESQGQSGTRTLEGNSCGAVVDAAALTLALILNPEAGAEESSVQPAEPEVDATPPARESEPKPPAPGPRVRLVSGAGMGVLTGELPVVGPDLSVGAGLGIGAGWGWLWGSATSKQHASVAGHPEAGGSLRMFSGTALGCWDLVSTALVLAPCGGVAFNRLEGTGEGVSDPEDAAIHWTSGALGAAVQLELTQWVGLRLSALGLVPFSRPALFLEGLGEVHRPDPFAFRAQLALLVDFL